MKKNSVLVKILIIILLISSSSKATESESSQCFDGFICSTHLTMFGEKSKSQNEKNYFDYVNPAAPKGGKIEFATIGTFDSLNPFILKGVSAAGISRIYDSLMTSSADDIFTRYPLIAERVMLAKDKSSIIFIINPEAKWHDGKPITADDVVFTFNTLIEQGNPFYASYYSEVEKVEKIDRLTVKFSFKNSKNRELPFIVAELTILPKHYYQENDFNKTTMSPPLGSSAYKVDEVKAGRQITYKRVADYWAADLPVNKGMNNFDIISYEYYKDATVAVEAFKAGEYDFRQENIAKNWAEAYDIPEIESGEVLKENIPHSMPTGIQSFALNLRKDKFKDVKVRKALNLAFDFEWTNKTLFYNSYTRTRSFFSNSIYEAKGLPEGDELKILEAYRDELPESVFTEEYNPPKSDGSGMDRQNLLKARELLKQAGWNVEQGVLKKSSDGGLNGRSDGRSGVGFGEIFEMEFLLNSPSMERVVMPYLKNLKKLGIQTNIRMIDPGQYVKRMEEFDFDITPIALGSSMLPGNELLNTYHSEVADVKGSGNYFGIKNQVVDEILPRIIEAQDKQTLIASTKALDRVLQHHHYVIPHWNLPAFRVLYRDKFEKPERSPRFGLGLNTWWSKEAK